MEPYEGIKPATASTEGIAKAGNDLGRVAQGIGDFFGGIGRNRATIRMHNKQMLHEAQMQQRAHEHNLSLMHEAVQGTKDLDTMRYAQMDKAMGHAEKVQKKGYERGQNIAADYNTNEGSVSIRSTSMTKTGAQFAAYDKSKKEAKKAGKKQQKAAREAGVQDILKTPKAKAIEGKSTGTWGGYGQEAASPSARTGTQNPKFMIETAAVQESRRAAEAPAAPKSAAKAKPKAKRNPSVKSLKTVNGKIPVASSGVVGERPGELDPEDHARSINQRARAAAESKFNKAKRKRNL